MLSNNMYSSLIVGFGGFAGAIGRYQAGAFFLHRYPTLLFPVGTFFVNAVGCFLIGFYIGVSVRHPGLLGNYKLFLVTGFLGGFTTFSAFGIETLLLFQKKEFLIAFGNIAGSLLICLLAVWVGIKIGEQF